MLLLFLLGIPIIGILIVFIYINASWDDRLDFSINKRIKYTGLITSIVNLFFLFIIVIGFDFSSNQFQFVGKYHQISYFEFYFVVN